MFLSLKNKTFVVLFVNCNRKSESCHISEVSICFTSYAVWSSWNAHTKGDHSLHCVLFPQTENTVFLKDIQNKAFDWSDVNDSDLRVYVTQ